MVSFLSRTHSAALAGGLQAAPEHGMLLLGRSGGLV